MSLFGLVKGSGSALQLGRAGWAASVSLVAVAAMLGSAERASADPTPIIVTTESGLNALVGAPPSLPGQINVAADVPLILNNEQAVTFSDTIALTGVAWANPYATFGKIGTGTLTLNNAAITGGEAHIAEGTVNFTGATAIDYLAVGSGAGSTARMTIAEGASASFGVGLSVGYYGGTGIATQTGGTVTIEPTCASEANCAAFHIGNQGGKGTYTIRGGDLIVDDGRLTIGRNTTNTAGTSGTLNIEGGTVTVRNSGYLAIAFGQEVGTGASTTGAINQTGGTLSIDATSSLYLAGTGAGVYNLDGGTLEIGDDSLKGQRIGGKGSYEFNLGGGAIRVTSDMATSVNATLMDEKTSTFDTNGFDAAWSGSLSGTGGLSKIGAGDLSIGTLSNSISKLTIASGDVSVGAGLLLGGSGVATTLDIALGSKLNVTGNFSLGSEDTFATAIDADGKAGWIKVSGIADLDGKLLINSDAGYSVGTAYKIVTAASFSQTYASDNFDIVHNFAFVTPELIYKSGTELDLQLTRNDLDFATGAVTSNQAAAANGIESVGAGDLFGAIEVLSTANAPAAFDAISGEIHASASGVLLNDSFFLRDAVLGRLQYPSQAGAAASASLASGYAEGDKRSVAPFPGVASAPMADPNTFWSQGFGSWGHSDGDSNVAKLDRSTGGIIVGYDRVVGNDWVIGAAAGYSRTSFDLDDRSSTGDSDNYHLLAYAGGKVSDVNVRLGASYTWNEIETTRYVSLPGFFEQEKADYSAGTTQLFGELGYDVAVSAATTIEPFAGLAYVHLSTDGYSETGGSAALSADSANQSVTYGTLGMRADHKILVGNANVTLQGALAWQHAWGDVTPTSTLAFAGGDAFQVTGAPIAKDAALIKAGFDVDLAASAKLGLFYAGQLASDAADNSIQGRFSLSF